MQAAPHPPQLPLSVSVFTQVAPHRVVPDGHTHAPVTHRAPPVHAAPQVPQFAASVWRFTHAPLQFVVPVPQVEAHAPLVHTLNAPHAVPQVPQFALSVCVFTHTPLQRVVPAGHAHTPATQAVPPVHA